MYATSSSPAAVSVLTVVSPQLRYAATCLRVSKPSAASSASITSGYSRSLIRPRSRPSSTSATSRGRLLGGGIAPAFLLGRHLAS